MSWASVRRLIANKAFMKNGEFSLLQTANTGFLAYTGFSEYGDARKEGEGVISSAVGAAGDIALGALINNPLAYMGITLAPELAKAGVSAYNNMSAYARQLQRQRRNVPFSNATFIDSQQTYTMRQAGMNLARQGQYAAAQTSLGNEAASVSYMGR